MRVVALTTGRNVPSARFRVRQHLVGLAGRGVVVREMTSAISAYADVPAPPWIARRRPVRRVAAGAWAAAKLAGRAPGVVASHRCDATWLERCLLPGWPTFERLLGRPLVLDVDDAIWLRPPMGERALRQVARQATVVLAGSRHIADRLADWAERVELVPTAIDVRRFTPDPAQRSSRFRIGWTGTASNFPYLEAVAPALAQFVSRHDAEILVVADAPPVLKGVDPSRLRYQRWSREVEVTAVQSMHVGIMPLAFDEWSRSKCAFKILQYLACGVPFVATPVGMNSDVLDLGGGLPAIEKDAWLEALEELYADEALRDRLGSEGRRLSEIRFSSENIGEAIADVFLNLG